MSIITKMAMEASLKKLLLKKTLDKITISDITDDCGISRMTFYYHFKDIYDLVDWICLNEAHQALHCLKSFDTWQQGFLEMFKTVLKSKSFFINVYSCLSLEKVEGYLYNLTYRMLYNVVDEKAKGLNVTEADKKFVTDYFKFVLVGLMLQWIKNGMKEAPEDIVYRLITTSQGNIMLCLERLANAADKKNAPQIPLTS